jgi:5-methylcytosine-specific restriction enzyme subunit McrC
MVPRSIIQVTKPFTLFEHESKHFDWTERDWTLVDRVNSALGSEVLRLGMKNGQKRIRAAQHVGVIRLRGRTIQVLPKIYQTTEMADEELKAREATVNLLHMLAYANEVQVREHELASLLRQTDDWFEILTRLFATHLREEWQRGAHRNYEASEDELSVLKGKWRIADQLRRPERRLVFAVTYDEFTADNKLNRIFRHVIERLSRVTRDNDNRQILNELRQWMDDVTLIHNVTLADTNPSLLTRLTERYRPLLNLARIFLDGSALQMTAGDLSTFAFVFDMNVLFENFVAGFLYRHASQILPDAYLQYDFLSQSRGARRFLATRENTSVFQTRPDLAFRIGDRFPLLIDTKYKILDDKDRRLGVSQSDFYQMHAYAHRYQCNRVVLIYPQNAESVAPIKACFKLEDCDKVIEVASINICVDLGSKSGRVDLMRELNQLFPTETSSSCN